MNPTRRSFLSLLSLAPLAAWLSSRVSAAPVLPASFEQGTRATQRTDATADLDAVSQRGLDISARFDRQRWDAFDALAGRQRYVDVLTRGYRGAPSHKLLVLTPSHASDPSIGAVMFYRDDGTVWTGVHVELSANGPCAGICTHVSEHDTPEEAQAEFAARHMLRNDAVSITEDGRTAVGTLVELTSPNTGGVRLGPGEDVRRGDLLVREGATVRKAKVCAHGKRTGEWCTGCEDWAHSR